MNINEFCRKAIEIPFRPKGRTWEKWDCWGLIYMAYKELFDTELPLYNEYKSIRDKNEMEILFLEGSEAQWTEVQEPEMGDVAILYMYGRASHIGLFIDRDRIIHCDQGINTCIQRIKDFRVEGIYRYGK